MDFGLIGKKLSHSFSQKYFTEKFRAEGIEATYHNFELDDLSQFDDLLRAYPNLRGLNVTIPYKQTIIPFIREMDKDSADIGAVNVISVGEGPFGGRVLTGYNTDMPAFRDSLAEFYHAAPGGAALILGTGGASRAVHHALRNYFAFDKIEFAGRTPSTPDTISYKKIQEDGLGQYRLIVNSTPVGQYPETQAAPDLPWETLTGEHYLYDLVYNPEQTQFLLKGRAAGAHIHGGMDMLVRQAELAWEIWKTA